MEKIDERGKVCPIPLFHTKRKICSMRSGEEVEIIVDDPTAKETIPKWSKQHGHYVVSIDRGKKDISGDDLGNEAIIKYNFAYDFGNLFHNLHLQKHPLFRCKWVCRLQGDKIYVEKKISKRIDK